MEVAIKAFIISLVTVIIIGIGAYFIFHKSPVSPAVTNTTPKSSSAAPTQNVANTITFDGNQFSPATITVKSGSTVTIKNTSSQDLQFDSDPHPAHTDDTDLNAGLVLPGKSQTFTVIKTGSFGYHDHLDLGIRGKITIE
ncbi:MAG TPA: cupredoxin domain-containing protein [Candidatus Saccharimonadales bacterium]|nr:cupredoxin domain-containing protein [Candidatus Saccharimonadales bacterium]